MSSDEGNVTPYQRKRRRMNSIGSSDDEDDKNNSKGIYEQEGLQSRSSERIRRKHSVEFKMPSRDEVWNDISDEVSPWKQIDSLKPRKRVNNLTRVTSYYNKDVYISDEDDLDDDFIDDGDSESEEDDQDETSEQHQEVSRKKKTKRRVKGFRKKLYTKNSSSEDSDTSTHDKDSIVALGVRRMISSDDETDPGNDRDDKVASGKDGGILQKGGTSKSDSEENKAEEREAVSNSDQSTSDSDSGIHRSTKKHNNVLQSSDSESDVVKEEPEGSKAVLCKDLPASLATSKSKGDQNGQQCSNQDSSSDSTDDSNDGNIHDRAYRQKQQKMKKFEEFQKLRKHKAKTGDKKA